MAYELCMNYEQMSLHLRWLRLQAISHCGGKDSYDNWNITSETKGLGYICHDILNDKERDVFIFIYNI